MKFKAMYLPKPLKYQTNHYSSPYYNKSCLLVPNPKSRFWWARVKEIAITNAIGYIFCD